MRWLLNRWCRMECPECGTARWRWAQACCPPRWRSEPRDDYVAALVILIVLAGLLNLLVVLLVRRIT